MLTLSISLPFSHQLVAFCFSPSPLAYSSMCSHTAASFSSLFNFSFFRVDVCQLYSHPPMFSFPSICPNSCHPSPYPLHSHFLPTGYKSRLKNVQQKAAGPPHLDQINKLKSSVQLKSSQKVTISN